LRQELAYAAARLDLPIAGDASLRVLISRWENGHASPDPVNRLLLQEAFGVGAESLMRLRLGPPRWWSGWWVTLRVGEGRLAGLR